jgi:hypothetical protein
MKTLKQLLEKTEKPDPTTPIEPDSVTSYVPKTKDEKRFMDKHVVKKTDDVNGNGDDHFRATNIKAYDRAATRHGYNTKQDQQVYEQKTLAQILGEKTLTPAEMNKREDIAKAMERDNPGMAMGKKMAIATATAKKVAEEAEQIDELKKSTIRSYANKKQAELDDVPPMPFKKPAMSKAEHGKAAKGMMGALARLSGKKPTSEEVERLEEGEVATAQYHQYHHEAKKMLEKISKGLDTHSKHVTDKNNYGGGSLHWGHVGDMKHFHRQIQDLHDSVLQQGEYAAPPKVMKMKEDVDLFDCFEESVRNKVISVYQQLGDEHKQVMIEMIEAEQYEEIIEVVSEVLNG